MHRFRARLLIACFLILPTPLLAQGAGESGPVPISLEDAVQQAKATSPATVQALGQSRVANAQFKTRIAAFVPNVSFYEGTSRSEGLTYVQGVLLPTGGGWGNNRGYSASMTIFNGGQNILDFQAAKANLDAADQNQIIQGFAIELNVKQQYFAVLAAREAVAAAQQQVKEANGQMAVTAAQVAGGSKSRADSLASAVAVGVARVALVSAQGNLVTANTALTRLVGGAHEVTALPSDTGLVPSISLDSANLVDLALRGPAVEQAKHLASANRSNWWASLSGYLPSLSVSYSSGKSWHTDSFVLGGGTPGHSTYLSFGLGYSLFDGLRREAGVVQADVNRDNAKASLRDARLAARENIAQYYAAFHTAETKIELQQLQIESATENVAAKDAQYRAGAASLVDVLQQQSLLATARQGLIQARLDARTAKAQIEGIIGKDIQ